MVISNEPLRWKLEIKGIITEQVITFKYLGTEIAIERNVCIEIS